MPLILEGDCLTQLATLADNSVDAIVTDPPYGLSNTDPDKVADTITRWATGERDHIPTGRGFMGQAWDGFVPPPAVWDECLRVLKPGGHMLVFAGSRTQDLMGLSIRLAGFEIRDSLAWIYGSGMPKSHDVSKAIDKAAGADREAVGRYQSPDGRDRAAASNSVGAVYGRDGREWNKPLTAPATPESRQWQGWGTALKPGQEPIILARKPLTGTVAGNVLEWGTGALNIDASRVGTEGGTAAVNFGETRGGMYGGGKGKPTNGIEQLGKGRWPANVLLDPEAAAAMDEQSGVQKDGVAVRRNRNGANANPNGIYSDHVRGPAPDQTYGSGGGASRFFPVFKYQAKAPKKERPVIERADGTKVQHPTVKPIALMRWLVTLITPPGGTVLDPFAGSGTTIEAAIIEGMNPIGIERDPDYLPLIHARIERASADDGGLFAA